VVNIIETDRLILRPCLYEFTPNARGRHSEPLRPEWRDVESLVRANASNFWNWPYRLCHNKPAIKTLLCICALQAT
jgi:hypothetical protein